MAKRRGASSSQLLSGTRLFEADCHKPQYRIDAAAWLKLVANCEQLCSPELPFLTASALLQNQYLALCQLVNSAGDLRQALAQLLYFRQQLAPYLYVQLQSGAYSTRIELRSGIGLGAQQSFIAEIWLSLILQLIRHQLGSTAGTVIYLQDPPSKTAASAQTLWQTEVRYQQACYGIEIANPLWRTTLFTSRCRSFSKCQADLSPATTIIAKTTRRIGVCRSHTTASLTAAVVARAIGRSDGTEPKRVKTFTGATSHQLQPVNGRSAQSTSGIAADAT